MKVLVIGDSCTDVFEYGICKRICPEAPVPILTPTSVKMSNGMAANVYLNLKALEVECDLITNEIRPSKTRFVDEVSNQMILRVDRHDSIKSYPFEDITQIDLAEYKAIVISDYDKGFLDEDHIRYLSVNHELTFMDSKKELGYFCVDVDFLKLNEKEYNQNWSFFHEEFYNNLVVTKGKDGAVLNPHKVQNKLVFPIENEHPVRDLTGAGDTFLAGLVAKYIEVENIEEAIRFANKCAAWVVTQKGVAIIDKSKIL